jgi:hypothetical protein
MSIKKQTKHWKTKDGRKIRICDLSDSHLTNIVTLLEKTFKKQTESNNDDENEIVELFDIAEGDMAGYYRAQHIGSSYRASPKKPIKITDAFPLYKDLTLEQKRRKQNGKHYNRLDQPRTSETWRISSLSLQ